MSNPSQPALLSLIVSDYVIKDAASGKLSLIGIFNGLYAQRFPCTHPLLCIYVSLAGGRGSVPCTLRMVPLGGGAEVFSLPGNVNFNDPAAIGEIIFQIQQTTIKEPGMYSIEFIANSELLGSRTLQVGLAPNNPPR